MDTNNSSLISDAILVQEYISGSEKAIEKLITDPVSGNIPIWFLNRRKDIETSLLISLVV